MKKIVVLLLLVLALAGCGKKESGVFTVQNSSSYTVTFNISQDYQSEKHTLASGQSKEFPWKGYITFYTISPGGAITYTQSSNKVVITDNTNTYKYTVRNSITPITILDNNQNILCLNKLKTDAISIPEGESEIECFRPITQQSIIIDTGVPFIINDKSYTPIEKIGDSYYFNEDNAGKIKTSKINISIESYFILIYK